MMAEGTDCPPEEEAAPLTELEELIPPVSSTQQGAHRQKVDVFDSLWLECH